MRSSKSSKRNKAYRYLRNHNAKKREACIRQKANLNVWINSTIEGKWVPKGVTLCALIQHPAQSIITPVAKTPKPEKEEKVDVEPVASHSKSHTVESSTITKQYDLKKKAQQQQPPLKEIKPSVEEKVPPPKGANQESNDKKLDKKGKLKNTTKSSDKEHKQDTNSSKIKQVAQENGSTVIKVEVKEFANQAKSTLIEELEVDVSPSAILTPEPSLTKCSVDSGVETLDENNIHQRSSSNSISNGSSTHDDYGNDTTLRQSEQNGITKFAQNVAEFVSQVQEKFESKTPEMVQYSVVSEQLKYAQKLESKPLVYKNDYSNLQEATLMDSKPRERKPRVNKLLPRDIEYCTYMMQTYGEDYQRMTNDPKNIYMDDSSGIARKIRIFRESPHYKEYLDSIKT